MLPAERRTLLLVLGFLTFASVYANVVIVPVLVQIASDFGTTAGTAGLVAAAYGVPGIVVAILAGPYSDRFGRKLFLVVGAAIMGGATILSALAGSFPLLIATRALAGLGASVIFPNVNATIGDTFPYRERGRAIATVVAMNTMASVVGLPIAGIVAEASSWRVSVAIVGVLALIASFLLLRLLVRDRPAPSEHRARALYWQVLTNRSAMAALLASLMGALFWFTWVTFLVLYFQSTYDLSLGMASTVALTMGLGVLIGSQIGGRLGDRIGHKHISAWTMLAGGFLLYVLTNAHMALLVAAALNLVLSTVIGGRFTANQALLSEQMPAARGTMLSISSSVVSAGMVGGAAVGGILVDQLGFWALGAFCAGVAVISFVIIVAFVVEEPTELEVA